MSQNAAADDQSNVLINALEKLIYEGADVDEEDDNLQSLHQRNLWWLLKKMILGKNWTEACGVLSVLLKGTMRETSPSRNRFKYWATMELLKRIKGKNLNHRQILSVFDIWMKKVGRLDHDLQPTSSTMDAQLEFIIYFIRHGNKDYKDIAYQAVLCVMQERGFETNPFANLVVGLAFYELWYASIPQDMQLNETSTSPTESQEQQQMYDSSSRLSSPIHHDTSTESDADDDIPKAASIFYAHGMPPWLLPLRLPDSSSTKEEVENFLYRHSKLKNENYKNAIKHFRVALYSEPPMFEAFHPLIQMLLMGDEVKEAFLEIEKFSQFPADRTSHIHLKLKASLFEHFDNENRDRLSTYFEDVLKKDPTCSSTLAKLVRMHELGDYGTERLVEMVSSHLDATFADWKTWRELATCLLRLSSCPEDDQQRMIPAIFTNPETESNWRLRCRWWLTRHFGLKRLQSEIGSGEVQLVTYKAAAATHLYGRDLKYVGKVTEYLQREKNSEMLGIVEKHMKNSVAFYNF